MELDNLHQSMIVQSNAINELVEELDNKVQQLDDGLSVYDQNVSGQLMIIRATVQKLANVLEKKS